MKESAARIDPESESGFMVLEKSCRFPQFKCKACARAYTIVEESKPNKRALCTDCDRQVGPMPLLSEEDSDKLRAWLSFFTRAMRDFNSIGSSDEIREAMDETLDHVDDAYNPELAMEDAWNLINETLKRHAVPNPEGRFKS